jgi:agmatine/peptidylarginine deiminase
MNSEKTLFPSEWHNQSGVQLTWPHEDTDWNYILEEVYECCISIAAEIAKREKLVIVTPYPERVKTQISGKADLRNVTFCACETNDTWARDHGAVTVFRCGVPHLLDFKFNGWGLKFAADRDNLITRNMFEENIFQKRCVYENRLNFVLEGGSLESDGKGTLLTTSECLLSPNRNGEWDRARIESYLKDAFGLEKVLWLDHGYLAGDDTDSHIDTLARLCPDDTILYVKCDETKDEHYDALHKMEAQLRTFSAAGEKPFRLIPLPMADAVVLDGERIPATYANFLVINGAVLVPSYNQPDNDERAKAAVETAFPGREVVMIDCSVLIKQHGSLHCVTMQFPEGVL